MPDGTATDIGTSPLYALQTVFKAHDHAVKPTEAGVYGVISPVFWSITTIVSVKYVTFMGSYIEL